MARRLTREEVMAIKALSDRGLPKRQIARQLGVDDKAVRYQLQKLEDGKPDGRRNKAMKADECSGAIHAWCETHASGERPINVTELAEHLASEHGYRGSYKSVLRFVRKHYPAPRIRTYRRVETAPGAQVQTDWGEFSSVPLHREGPTALSAFVMTLSHSRMSAVIWSRRKDTMSWLHCHNEAFRRLGGIPLSNRIDNPKTAVIRGAGPWGTINPTYKNYARCVGFVIDLCLPRQAWAKGKVERRIGHGRRGIFDFSRYTPTSLEELQAETDERMERDALRRVCPATGLSVFESWQRERADLRAIQRLPEPFDISVTRPVHRDCMVHFEGRQYAVPFAYVGRHVEVRGCAKKVQVIRDDAVLCEYERHTEARVLIDESCYEGESTNRVIAPPPLGKCARALKELAAAPGCRMAISSPAWRCAGVT